MIRDTYHYLLSDNDQSRALVKEVVDVGYTSLPNFFDDASQAKIAEFVSDRSVGNKKNEGLKDTFGYEVRTSDEIFKFCDTLHRLRCELTGMKYVPLKIEKQSVGIGYKDARNNKQTVETEYHYDAAYTNLVAPLLLTGNSQKGEGNLIMFPNLRRHFPRIINAPLSTILRRIPLARKLFGYTVVQYSVGSLFIFFGDVSLHGVPPITEGERMIMAINSHW